MAATSTTRLSRSSAARIGRVSSVIPSWPVLTASPRQADAFIAVMADPGQIDLDWEAGRLFIGGADRWIEFLPTIPPPVPPGVGG